MIAVADLIHVDSRSVVTVPDDHPFALGHPDWAPFDPETSAEVTEDSDPFAEPEDEDPAPKTRRK